jgi:hypothetical protein
VLVWGKIDMKLTFFGALVGAVMLALAAPASATTVTGTSSVNGLGAFTGDATLNFGAGATGTNVDAFGGGKGFYDYIFSFTLNQSADVTISATATANGNFNFDDHFAALFNTAQAGSALDDTNPPIGPTNGAGLLALDATNGATPISLALGAGTYYLRLFGLVPGNPNSGHALSAVAGTLTIAATPIPAALPLFGTALLLCGFMGWRRKTATAAAAA